MNLEHNFFAFPRSLDELLLRIVQGIWILVVLGWIFGSINIEKAGTTEFIVDSTSQDVEMMKRINH